MRGGIVVAMIVCAATLAGCGRKDSLYIEPGKPGPAAPVRHGATETAAVNAQAEAASEGVGRE
jgi:predicted small lipoprotein YifL